MFWLYVFQFYSLDLAIFDIGLSLSSYFFTTLDVCFWVFLATTLYRGLFLGEHFAIARSTGTQFLILLAPALLVSGIVPFLRGDPDMQLQFVKSSGHFLYLWLFGMVASSQVISTQDFVKALKYRAASAPFICGFGIYQIIARAFDWPFAWLMITNPAFFSSRDPNVDRDAFTTQLSLQFEGFFRATSIYSEPSALAGYCTFMLTLILVPQLYGHEPIFKSRGYLVTAIVLTFISFFLTFSLTAMVIAAGFVLYTIKVLGLFRTRVAAYFGGGIALLLIADLAVEAYSQSSVFGLFYGRVASIVTIATTGKGEMFYGDSFFLRFDSVKQGLELFSTYPFTGIGLGCYAYIERTINYFYGDNSAIAVLGETGTIGFVVFLGMLIGQFYFLHRVHSGQLGATHLTKETKRLATIATYVALKLLITSFTANAYITFPFWLYELIVVIAIGKVHQELGLPFFSVKFGLSLRKNEKSPVAIQRS